ncbi:hypothetical protein M3J07_010016 [Ascochyta lentis]
MLGDVARRDSKLLRHESALKSYQLIAHSMGGFVYQMFAFFIYAFLYFKLARVQTILPLVKANPRQELCNVSPSSV